MLHLITAVTCPCFWHPQIPWESCMASLDLLSKKGVFFSSVSRDIKILLLWEKVNCCCLLTLFLRCDTSLQLPFPKPRSPFSSTPSIQVRTQPISEFAQQLSTLFSFTLTDIKFYLSFDWSVGYTYTSLQAIILLLLSESPLHLTGLVFCNCADTFVLTANYLLTVWPLLRKKMKICGENPPSIYKPSCLISSQSYNLLI